MNNKTKKIASTILVTTFITNVSPLSIFADVLDGNQIVKTENQNTKVLQENDVVNIPDENLKRGLNSALGQKYGTDITVRQLNSLKKLYLSNSNITNLEGLQYCTNLTELDLFNNQIENISQLSTLGNLTELEIFGNKITDISALSELINLTNLQLGGNKVSDVTPLKELSSLEEINLSYNKVSDITGLSKLNNLMNLDLAGNQVKDIKSLSGLTNLRSINLNENGLRDISGVSELVNLTNLSLCENNISDISPLSKLTNLESMGLHTNQISDISVISNLIKLDSLTLFSNKISDLSPLKNLRINHLNARNQSIILPKIINEQGKNLTIKNEVIGMNGEYLVPEYISNAGIYNRSTNYINWKSENLEKVDNVTYQFTYSKDGVQVFSGKVTQPIDATTEYKPKINELVGSDRFDTAVKVSQTGWNNSEKAVLVNCDSLADALSVTPFAAQENAPVLLSDSKSLNTSTKAELERLGVKKVYVIGGTSAISENVANELKSMGITIERIYGEDRFETSLAIAKKLKNVNKIAVVNGEKGFADAVSIAPVCARDNMAIVYASSTNGLKTFEDYINTNDITTSYVVGGTTVLPDNLISGLKNPVRISGEDRNLTNLNIIETFFSNTNYNNQTELNNIFVAKNGYGKPNDLIDALSVGVLAAKQNAPVMLVSPNGLDNNQSTALYYTFTKELTKVGGNGNESAFEGLKEQVNHKK
ncbi:cell wall-binding repeat-containing protein [Romboutsia sp.]|uniref:cell wall-binding repeat-containing protein n=1 Tax=Romboutsia sp. TaxID=1965302 RepID=UPI003F30C3C4